jgi:hypothetical protein
MSVQFSSHDAPTETVPCWMCADVKRWEEDSTAKCSGTCDGMREQSTLPEVSFANGNARGVLALMGCDADDLCGTLSVEEIPVVLQRLLKVINMESQRQHLVALPSVEKGAKGCTVFRSGNTDEGTLRRLSDIQNLLSQSAKGGFGVSWG